MGKNTKAEHVYMDKIKDYNVDVDETNEITIDNKVIVKCIQEIIKEVEEIQNKDRKRFHMIQPKLDCMNFSIIAKFYHEIKLSNNF